MKTNDKKTGRKLQRMAVLLIAIVLSLVLVFVLSPAGRALEPDAANAATTTSAVQTEVSAGGQPTGNSTQETGEPQSGQPETSAQPGSASMTSSLVDSGPTSSGSEEEQEVELASFTAGMVAGNATTGQGYATLAEAVANAGNGDVIMLLDDVVQDSYISWSGKTITITSAEDSVFTVARSAANTNMLFYVRNGGGLVLQNIVLEGNTTPGQPLVVADNGNVSVVVGQGAVLQNNTANHGGGVYINGSANGPSTLVVEGNAVIQGNTVGDKGGAVLALMRHPGDSVVVKDSVQILNNTAAYGGGLFVRRATDIGGTSFSIAGNVVVSGNVATKGGGGIYFGNVEGSASQATSLVVGDSVQLLNNSASATDSTGGGGIYYNSSHPADSLTLAGGVVIGNNSSAKNGGGVYFNARLGGGSVNLAGGVVNGNIASENGGGLFFRPLVDTANTSEVKLSGTSVTGNYAPSGGGLYLHIAKDFVAASGTFDMTGGALSGNTADHGAGLYTMGRFAVRLGTAVAGNTAAKNGGGVYVTDGGTLLMQSGASLQGNTAGASGGGAYVQSGSAVDVKPGANITSNKAQTGAGLFLNYHTGGTIAGNISGNDASVSGGGIYYTSGNTTVSTSSRLEIVAGAAITGNTAASDGAGTYLTGSATETHTFGKVVMNGGLVANNEAGRNGGGVFVGRSVFEMNGGALENNTSEANKGHALWVDKQTAALDKAVAGTAILNVGEDAIVTANSTNSTVVIGAAKLGHIVFGKDFTMTSHLLLQNDTSNKSTLEVKDGATLTVSGKLTLGVQEGASAAYAVTVNPNGGSIRFNSDAEAMGSDFVNQNVADMYAVPGSSYGLYAQWPSEQPNRVGESFAGWKDTAQTGLVGAGQMTVNSNRTLTAQWAVLEIAYYDGNTPITGLTPSQFTYGGGTTDISGAVPAKPGYRFEGWYTSADFSDSAVTQFSNNTFESKEFYAKWTQITYTITASAGAGGSISDSGASTVVWGGSKTYTITPQSGYRISRLLVDGVEVGVAESYTFTNVKANRTIEAQFAPIPAEASSEVSSAANGTSSAPAYSSSGSEQTSSSTSASAVSSTPASSVASGQDEVPVSAPSSTSEDYKNLRQETLQQMVDDGAPVFYIGGSAIPLNGIGHRNVWALLNLILAAVAVLAAVLAVFAKRKDEQDDEQAAEMAGEDEERTGKSGLWKWMGLLSAVVSVVTFVLTQNMRNLMVLVDIWTPLMAVLAAVAVVMMALAKRKGKKDEEAEESAQ